MAEGAASIVNKMLCARIFALFSPGSTLTMAEYKAPEREIRFVLREVLNLDQLAELDAYAEATPDIIDGVLDEAAKFIESKLVPLREPGDAQGCTLKDGVVTVPDGYADAYREFQQSGWVGLANETQWGGQGLPYTLSKVVEEMVCSANVAFDLYPSLTTGCFEALQAHASDADKQTYLPKLGTGEWTGTMCMTEPQAGSDLAAVRTRAVKQDDGSYRIHGTKIFITSGEHEMADNIVHYVLARCEDSPPGVKGLSTFIVPKFLVNDDGSLGARNDVTLAGLFHKMGWRGTTSTALNFGDNGECVGYLVGKPHAGLSYMFQMMNEARIGVGMGAVMLGYAGYLYSLDYARQRPQGRQPDGKDPASPQVAIVEHADVRRMLLTQKAYVEGAFDLGLYAARLFDDTHTLETAEERTRALELLDLPTPIVKSWPSEYGPEANDLAIQVLGGHGYINEHPVEMFYRDNRLNPIHEGTTGIQSLDLLARKVPMNNLAGYKACLAEMQKTIDAAQASELNPYAEKLQAALATLNTTTESLLGAMMEKPIDLALANSVKYLDLFGHVVIAWLWLKQGLIAEQALAKELHPAEADFYKGKLQAMRYFFGFELPLIEVWSGILISLDSSCYDMQDNWF